MDNPTLKITQTSLGNRRYHCELTLDSKGHFTATIDDFSYHLDLELQAEIRWYLEQYPQYPDREATASAVSARKKLKEIGETLFSMLFLANEDSRLIWERVKRQIGCMRVEVFTMMNDDSHDDPLVMGPPWELLRDPEGGEPLAVAAQAFVHIPTTAIQFPSPAIGEKEKLRILFVIVHPDELDEYPFRSVVRHLLQGLSINVRNRFEWEILYPASFSALAERLRRAKEENKPFHVVHYDGEGISINYTRIPYHGILGWLKTQIVSLLMGILNFIRTDHQAFLLLDPHNRGTASRPVSGSLLGELMNETGTPWLVLNACHAVRLDRLDFEHTFSDDPYLQAHALVRVGLDAVKAGANGVVTLGHIIPTVSSAQFAIDIYHALGTGCSLGEAVNRGRQRLYRHSKHKVGLASLNLPDDWSVPMVFEATPLRFFPVIRRTAPLLHANITFAPTKVDNIIPHRPSRGLFGRDETLLVLMRALRQHSVVLLQGQVGSGKTQVAAELVRWGMEMGVFSNHVVIWSDFSYDRSLDRILDDYRRALEPFMEELNLSWPKLRKEKRTHIPWQFLFRIPVLWIWDHVESTNTMIPPWEDQQEISLFLRIASKTKARFLLLSHRDEWSLLKRLPERISLPPLPTQECLAMIRSITAGAGRNFVDPAAWRPVLDFVDGNPSALILIVESILREKMETPKEINELVEHLQSMREIDDEDEDEGERETIDDDDDDEEEGEEEDNRDVDDKEKRNALIAEGYDYPLSVILAYQFVDANFTSVEQCRLSLLYLFKGFVDVDILTWMSDADDHDSLPIAFRDVTRKEWISLLDRAVRADLLSARDEGYYDINPIRSVIFTRLFLRAETEFKIATEKSYLNTMEDIGNYYYDEYQAGHYEMLDALPFEEANLLYAWQLARWRGWWHVIISVAQALLSLYQYTEKQNEWDAIVDRLTQDFVDSTTNGALSGNEEREEFWGIVTDYRVAVEIRNNNWEFAERLQQLHIDWDRRRAAGLLDRPPASLGSEARSRIKNLALSINYFGHLLQKQGKIECVRPYQVALELNERIDNCRAAATIAIQLAQACLDQPELREQTEGWYWKAVKLAEEETPEFRSQIQQWPERVGEKFSPS